MREKIRGKPKVCKKKYQKRRKKLRKKKLKEIEHMSKIIGIDLAKWGVSGFCKTTERNAMK